MPFSELGHGEHGRERNKLLEQLSETEKQILDGLTPADKERVRSLHKTDLFKNRGAIVGVRSEDLLYFLECMHKGYIPVGKSPIRQKRTEEGVFFLSVNPESEEIKQNNPGLITPDTDRSFREVVHLNSELYAHIAKIKAVYRNLIVPYIPTEDLNKLAREYLCQYSIDYESKDFLEAYFYEMARNELDKIKKDVFTKRQGKPALFALGKYLKNKGINTEPLAEFLSKIGNRGSICIGFSNNLLKQYTVDLEVIEDVDEMVIRVPNGKLSLETVWGFETMGDFEDEVLNNLVVK